MPNGGITKQTFESTTTDGKLSILFDQQAHIIQTMDDMKQTDNSHDAQCHTRWIECDVRFKKIEIGWAKVVGGILILAVIVPIISTVVIQAIF